MSKLIDKAFFENYASTGKHYNEIWRSYTGFNIFKEYLKDYPEWKFCLVLGSATGKILEALDKECNIQPTGMEISEYAFNESLKYADEYVLFHGDIRELITSMPYGVDVIYSNSLMYLPEEDIVPFLKECPQVGKYFFWYGSMQGFSVEDSYRVTLQPYEWWNEQFEKAGFVQVKRYLWKKSI